MYHIPLRAPAGKYSEVNYDNLLDIKNAQLPVIIPDNDTSLPEAPPGFVFYRVKIGDTLVSLAIRFNISQNKIRRYNNQVCFGHRLTHIIGKLLVIPTTLNTNLTTEMQEQLSAIYTADEEEVKAGENLDGKEYEEPNEDGKYQLRKAFLFHCSGLDELRADYYLGEANWNVRKALNAWKSDCQWEKAQEMKKLCSVSAATEETVNDGSLKNSNTSGSVQLSSFSQQMCCGKKVKSE